LRYNVDVELYNAMGNGIISAITVKIMGSKNDGKK
jgi:hypothetical protein